MLKRIRQPAALSLCVVFLALVSRADASHQKMRTPASFIACYYPLILGIGY